jgi:hypothetical protein
MEVEHIIRPFDTDTPLKDKFVYISHGWQMFAKEDRFRTPTVKLARGCYDNRTYSYVGSISLLDEDTHEIKVCACYLPQLKLNSEQSKVFDELLDHIQEEYFNGENATRKFDRETLHELMDEIYSSLDDYLCDGIYLGELMQRFNATEIDLSELCFMLRDVRAKY